MTQRIQNSGFSARTLLIFTWSGQARALRDDVLQEAIDIEGVARDLLEIESQAKGKSKETNSRNDTTNEWTSKTLSKWLGKLTKK
jgi:hypothetical protein